MLRDGGPQAMKAEDLPELSLDWIGKTPAATAKNVVNALCFHRFGERVYVDRVHVVSDRARGVDFLVTLNLAAREILGSCNSINVRNFDRDTKELLELLKEREEMDQLIYHLKVTTPGAEKDVDDPMDLWRCAVLPCYVAWRNILGERSEKWLFRMENTTNTWRLADCEHNWVHGHSLTKEQEKARFKIETRDIWSVKVKIDRKAMARIKKAKAKIRDVKTAEKLADKEAARLAAEADGVYEEDAEEEVEEEEEVDAEGEEVTEKELETEIQSVLGSADKERPLSKARQLLGESA